MEFLFGDLLDGAELVDAGVVHEDINRPIGALGLGEQPLDIGRFRDIALDRDCLASAVGNFDDNLVRAIPACRVVYHDGSPRGRQLARNFGPDPLGSAGDNRNPVGKLTHRTLPYRTAGTGTLDRSGPRPSAIVKCEITASRSTGYGRFANIAVCIAAMTSPASEPIIVKPRMRSSFAPTRTFIKPCFSSVASVRSTALIGSRATRTAMFWRCASLSLSPT